MSENKLIKFCNRGICACEFVIRHSTENCQEEIEHLDNLTEIKKKLEIYEQLFGDELIEIQEQSRQPSEDLVEKMMDMIDHNTEILPYNNRDYIERQVRKLLQGQSKP